MSMKTPLCILLTAAVLVTGGGTTLAQDLLPTTRAANVLSDGDTSSTRGVTTELRIDRTGIVAVGGQQIVSANNACVCTNLNYVSVICPDCDREAKFDRCYTHDRACQDAAQNSGIREHTTFFCTTNE